jgi:hypothetical protein
MSSLVENLPKVALQLADLTHESSRGFRMIENGFGKIAQGIQSNSALERMVVNSNHSASVNRMRILDCTTDALPSYSGDLILNPSTDGAAFLQALSSLGSIARKAFVHLYREQHIQLSRTAVAWIMTELHRLLARVHSAAAEYHVQSLTSNVDFITDEFSTFEMPRRFRNQAVWEERQSHDALGRKHSGTACISVTESPRQTAYCTDLNYFHHFYDSAGILYISYDSAQSAQLVEFARVCFCFIPKKRTRLPGVSFATCSMRNERDVDYCYESVLTAFDILPESSPLINEVKSGDLGVSRVLKRLRAREAWAGDRDNYGRSLLSVSSSFPEAAV